MLEKLLSLRTVTVAVIVLLVVISSAFYILFKNGKIKFDTKVIVYAGLAISLAFILSSIRIFRMPQGGSITPASMLPILIFSFMFGPVPGMIAGALYGFLQLLQDAFAVHWIQVLLDYPLAFAAIGLAGSFKRNRIAGILTGSFARFLFHFISGFAFFASYAPEGQSPVLYSLVYNGSFMTMETIITVILAIPVLASLKGRLKPL